MLTTHNLLNMNSQNMVEIETNSIDLIVTSPPYPMIAMWDSMFKEQSEAVSDALCREDGMNAFLYMHEELNKVWSECDRVLKDGGIICINIGDATRTIGGRFALYPNHAKIIEWFFLHFYDMLPDIHWMKPSNSPNKFMGSGMYPVGAYVTYEHEYILVFRKGSNREFSSIENKDNRRESAYFWEERNQWFSDKWEITGTKQDFMGKIETRERNASYPIEIPYRLINMYSVKGDTVLDPFSGMATTSIACMLSERNSIGVEQAEDVCNMALDRMNIDINKANQYLEDRIDKHNTLYADQDEQTLLWNNTMGIWVKTKQETDINIRLLDNMMLSEDGYVCEYRDWNKTIWNTI